MAKEAIGVIVEVNGERALVMPTAHTGCDSNNCCQGEGVKKIQLEMLNSINATIGDTVIYEAKEGGMIMVAFIIFILPMILVFLGAGIGLRLFETLSMNKTVGSVVGGVLFFAISLVIIKLNDKAASKNINLLPVIKKNLNIWKMIFKLINLKDDDL